METMPRTIWYAGAFALLSIAAWPDIRDLGLGIRATYGRSSFVSVTGDLLIYTVLFAIIAWAAIQLGMNVADSYIAGRTVRLIAPVRIGAPDSANTDGVKLAQLLSANLSAMAVSAKRSIPSDNDFAAFKNSQAYKLLPDGGATSSGFDTIFSAAGIGNAPVMDSLNLDANAKFQVSGTDLTPYIAWLIDKFRRHDSLELTILTLGPGRRLIWNLDTARSGWDSVTLDGIADDNAANDAAIEEFSWKYAHSLAAGYQASAAFRSLTIREYRTIVRAYALYADAIRASGQEPDRDMRPEFVRILAFLETGADPGPGAAIDQCGAPPPAVPPAPPAAASSASPCEPVTEVTARWWELSKSFAVIATLAGQPDKARTYASQALALLDAVCAADKPVSDVIAAIQALARKPTKTATYLAAAVPRSNVILLSAASGGSNGKDGKVLQTDSNGVQVFEPPRRITGAVSALEAVQLPGFPPKSRLVMDLPLEILNSPALPKLIRDDLDPKETIIYTRADAGAARHLQAVYPNATVHADGNLTSEAIRDRETRATASE